jgi:ribonuclease P protein subunit RPR2
MRREKVARRRSSKPGWQQEIAEERMRILMHLAGKEFGPHPERSDRYVQLARKIGMRYNVKMPRELKLMFCPGCGRYIVPGRNCVVRASARTRSMEVKCLECGKVSRMPYAREKREGKI